MSAFNLADNKADLDNKGNKPSEDYEKKLKGCKNLKDLQEVWKKLPEQEKGRLFVLKEELKKSYAN
jgi:hypothetical protein